MVRDNLTLRGRIFYPLLTLPELPTDKDLLKRYIELMYYFLIADASHDIIGIKGKQFADLNIYYVESIKLLSDTFVSPLDISYVSKNFLTDLILLVANLLL